jgi:hypothetical protein
MPRRRGKLAKTARLAAIGGALAAAAGALASQRDRIRSLLGSSEPAPSPGPTPSPGPSNYDAPGPPANTATPVPVPEAYESPTIDERAEEAAAAAEAANIGGQVSDYAGPEGAAVAADEEQRPLMEAGEGEAEGQEQAEAELVAAAEPTAPGESPEQHQIEDVLESQPTEQIEPLVSEEPPGDAERRAGDEGSEWRTWSGRSINP